MFIDYLDTLEYKSLLEELNLEYSSNKFSADYYKTMDILYLYYNYEKEYYMDLTDFYLEGYEFDPNESYTLYEKYEKKEEIKVEDIYTFNKTITPVKTNLKNTLKPKNMGNALKNVDANTNITGDEKKFNLKKPIIYKKTVKQQTQNSLKKKYYLPIFILLFIVLRKFYVKFKYKNAT